VEDHLVVAGLALDDVAPFAGVPDERVVTGAHQGRVVTGPAEDLVVALATDQDVHPRVAVDRQGEDARLQPAGVHHVIAALGADRQPVQRPLTAGNVDRGGQALDGCRTTRPGDHDRVVPARALDGDGVGRAVAGAAARGALQVEVDLGHVGAGEVVDGNLI